MKTQAMSATHLMEMACTAQYNAVAKDVYRRKALAWLRLLAKELGLEKSTYDVRFNPGGIAVSGDAILHHDHFYVHLNAWGGYWRTCKGRKDYQGGNNHSCRAMTLAELAGEIRQLALCPPPQPVYHEYTVFEGEHFDVKDVGTRVYREPLEEESA